MSGMLVCPHCGKSLRRRYVYNTLESVSTDKLPRLRYIHIIKTSLGDKDGKNEFISKETGLYLCNCRRSVILCE